MPEATGGHQTPEDRIAAGEQFATFEDLEGLDDKALFEIAVVCPVEPADPDACVPCRAFQILDDRERAAREAEEEEGEVIEPLADLINKQMAEAIDQPMPLLEKLMESEPVWHETPAKPVAERFAEKVHELDLLVTEIVEGPPIPPPNVTMEELATLVVAAEKWASWLRNQTQQGFQLSEEQAFLGQQVESLVGRLRRG